MSVDKEYKHDKYCHFFCHVPINAHTKSSRLLKLLRFTSCNIHPSVQRCTLIGEQPLSVSSPLQVSASRPIRRSDRIVCAVGHGTCFDKRTEEVRNLEILMSHLKNCTLMKHPRKCYGAKFLKIKKKKDLHHYFKRVMIGFLI